MKPLLLVILTGFVLVADPLVAQNVDEPSFTLSKGDVIKSAITQDAAGQTILTITLSPEKRLEFNAFTEHNLNKQVKIVCNDKVVSEPVIRSIIKGPSMETVVDTPAEAGAISESMLASLSPHELESKQQELEAQTAKMERASHRDPLQNELVSGLQTALDTHDKSAFEKCFNFDGTNDELRKDFPQVEKEIFALPSYHVSAHDRIDQGKAHATKEGKNYTLNGEWTFEVEIHDSKAPGKGFVLPAGMANGKCQVLLTVKDK